MHKLLRAEVGIDHADDGAQFLDAEHTADEFDSILHEETDAVSLGYAVCFEFRSNPVCLVIQFLQGYLLIFAK